MTAEYPSLSLGFSTVYGRSTNASNKFMTSLTPGAAANTMGGWITLVASTDFDIQQLDIDLDWNPTVTSNLTSMIDIGIGPSGYEQVVIKNLVAYTEAVFTSSNGCIRFPFQIPAGSRIAARSQCNVASGTAALIGLRGHTGALSHAMAGAMVETIGAVGTSTQGTSVSPNATAGVEGSYAQITAATTVDYVGIWVMFDGLNTNPASGFCTDIAIGASGSEIIIFPQHYQEFNGDVVTWIMPFVPIRIPAGTRIAARTMANNASIAPVGVTIYGVSL